MSQTSADEGLEPLGKTFHVRLPYSKHRKNINTEQSKFDLGVEAPLTGVLFSHSVPDEM